MPSELEKAGALLRDVERLTKRQRAKLHVAIRKAVRAGQPVARVAGEAGLSRQAVYQILKHEEEK